MPIELAYRGETLAFDDHQVISLGRSDASDIPLDDTRASRNHALIRPLDNGRCFLMDMGSTNGTLVNDRRVTTPHELKDHDVIRIGHQVLVFRRTTRPEALDHPDEEMTDEDATRITTGTLVQRITLLVTDVRGYTALSAAMAPDELARIMARLFRSADEIATRRGGVVDKFIGDAIMIRWVADAGVSPVPQALRTALEIHRRAESINREFPQLPHRFRIGAGINTGDAVLANVGASHHRDYTALGDAVNLAFRFETATKDLGTDLVIGAAACREMPDFDFSPFRTTVEVRGKEAPEEVAALGFAELAERLRDPEEGDAGR